MVSLELVLGDRKATILQTAKYRESSSEMVMMKVISYRWFCLLFLTAIFAVFWGCSSKQEPAKTAVQNTPPPEPVTARFAFQRIAIQARSWAADAEPLRITSVDLKEVPSEGGKSAAWAATFVSPQLKKARSFTYSVVDSPGNVREGVIRGTEETWSGPSGQAHPFVIQMFKVDSDQAYVAAVKESKTYLKKNPDTPVHFLLEFTPRFPTPAWRVFWGQTLGSSEYSVFIDSVTGKYLQTLS
jgi:hypothetical protein